MRLEARGITKTFGENQALRGVNLSLPECHSLAIIGPSGGGKTTLLRIVAGLAVPDTGSLAIDGREVAFNENDLLAHRRSIGTVFQAYNLFPHLSARENVLLPLVKVHAVPPAEARETVDALFDRFQLSAHADRRPAELSGGQQQRVALARALVLEPAVLLFDEPLSNLDARLRREMREEIRAIQQRLGLTVAYVTHDQSEALAVSDLIIVMHDGLIAQSGSPQDMYERPQTEFVAGFMGEAMLFPGVADATGCVSLGPLTIEPKQTIAAGAVKVAVRPEAWQIQRDGAGLASSLIKRSYLGSFYEYTFKTALGNIFVVSPDLTDVLPLGTEVGLMLADHGVSVVKAD